MSQAGAGERGSEREKKCKFKTDRHQGLQSDSAFKSLVTVYTVATGLGVGMKNQVELKSQMLHSTGTVCFIHNQFLLSMLVCASFGKETEIGLTKQLHANKLITTVVKQTTL